jgi:hypothetical protein
MGEFPDVSRQGSNSHSPSEADVPKLYRARGQPPSRYLRTLDVDTSSFKQDASKFGHLHGESSALSHLALWRFDSVLTKAVPTFCVVLPSSISPKLILFARTA